MRVYRLEFLQPDGRWCGPYCAEWMTQRAFELRAQMLLAHNNTEDHPDPLARLFAENPGRDRYVCATLTERALREWFGSWFDPFLDEGGHIAAYDLPPGAVGFMDGKQVVYQQRQGQLHSRFGYPSEHLVLIERIHPSKANL